MWVDQAQIHHIGERGQCPRGQPCPASVESQGNLDVKDTSVLVYPQHQRGGLRVLKIYHEEYIINSVACVGETQETSIDARRLKTRVYIYNMV